jgi:hypothetical protein
MFADPASNSTSRLFSVPGWELELLGAAVFTVAVACYLTRVVWLAIAHARQMEKRAMQATVVRPDESGHSGPYCAG